MVSLALPARWERRTCSSLLGAVCARASCFFTAKGLVTVCSSSACQMHVRTEVNGQDAFPLCVHSCVCMRSGSAASVRHTCVPGQCVTKHQRCSRVGSRVEFPVGTGSVETLGACWLLSCAHSRTKRSLPLQQANTRVQNDEERGRGVERNEEG